MHPVGLAEWHDGGGLPVVLSAPHGGDSAPWHLPDRTTGCVCGDAGTLELAMTLHAEFGRWEHEGKQSGLRPHLVASRLQRRKLDPNRPRGARALSCPARCCCYC